MRRLAPIALFVYNRPVHARRTLSALKKNALSSESRLVIYSDGPKEGTGNERLVAETRRVIREQDWCGEVRIVESSANKGLARSVIEGITQVLHEDERVIVMEDDLVTSEHFLRYMNEGLELYEDEMSVASIHGYVYDTGVELPDYFFIRGADCWGWATWRRAWALFNPDGANLLGEIERKGLGSLFDFNGTYPYRKMLRDQIDGKNSSWAIRWYASAFLAGAYTLYPGRSLVANIGFDGSGTHCGGTDMSDRETFGDYVPLRRIPVRESSLARKAFQRYFKARFGVPGPIGTLARRAIRILRRIGSRPI
jgi:hypothetical protein